MNQTPFKFVPLPGRLNFPGHSLTLIVKGTFDLRVGARVVPAAAQPFPTGDEFFPDDEEKRGSPRYESDFAWHKPRADLLLVGACHAPGGRAVPSCPATFRVGNKSKTLAIFGQRHWEKSWLTWKATDPEPFTRMDLRYENSFGGEKFPANPVGRGLAEKSDDTGGKFWPLPNIEDPAHLIDTSGNRPAPAGFGPLGKMWATRRGKLGTYKGAYVKTRWPWVPEDFDWTHFNAAPEEMQLEGYLRGDEQLYFENLHPKHPLYQTQLPGLRVRGFLEQQSLAGPAPASFSEIPLKLDTLWVDMEAEKLVLIWRGWTSVSAEDHPEVSGYYVTAEALDSVPLPVPEHRLQFLALRAKLVQPFAPEAPPPTAPKPGEAAAAQPPSESDAAAQKAKEEMAAKITAQTNAMYAHLGIKPENLPADFKKKQAGLIDKLAETDPKKIAAAERESMKADLKQAFAKAGVDVDNLAPVSAKARAEQARFARELGFTEAELDLDPDAALYASMTAALMPKLGLDPENLGGLMEEAKKLKINPAKAAEAAGATADGTKPAPLTAASLQQRLARGESFEGADLSGLDFSGLDLTRADFAGANLAGAKFCQAKLKAANFTKANLNGADFTEADLSNAQAARADFSGARMRQANLKAADLTGAKLAKADLTKAILDGAILEEAGLQGACLRETSAIGALFPRADLTGAVFQKGVCVRAEFSKATLNQADFQEANLTAASVIGAVGHQLNLTRATLKKLRASGCDFTGGRLVEAQGDGSVWKGANLSGADFRHAQMEDALFTSACLRQANLSAANMKFGRFNQASLAGAKLIRMNLFRGNLEKADLTQADFSGANLYEADFLNVIMDRTVTAGANLKMTKLDSP